MIWLLKRIRKTTKQFKEMEKINSISTDKTNKILKLFGMKTVYVISGVRIGFESELSVVEAQSEEILQGI